MADAMMESLGEANGVKWYWAEPGRFERPGVYYWDGTSNVLCVPYPAKPEAPAQAAPAVAQVPQDELLSLLQRARLYTNGACVHAERAPFAVFRSDLDAAIAALEKQ